jgi:hypothetical protein
VRAAYSTRAFCHGLREASLRVLLLLSAAPQTPQQIAQLRVHREGVDGNGNGNAAGVLARLGVRGYAHEIVLPSRRRLPQLAYSVTAEGELAQAEAWDLLYPESATLPASPQPTAGPDHSTVRRGSAVHPSLREPETV